MFHDVVGSCLQSAFVLAFGLALLCGACSDKPSESDCTRLLERLVDLEIEAAGTSRISPAMKDDLDKQRKELIEHWREPFLKDCTKNMPVEVVKCGVSAKSKAEYAKCEQ